MRSGGAWSLRTKPAPAGIRLNRYFGAALAANGATESPCRYVGRAGYYQNLPGRYYVQARLLDVGRGRWLSRDPLLFNEQDGSWHRYVGSHPVGFKSLTVLVRRVRQKIEADPEHRRLLLTIRGFGYKLLPETRPRE